MKKIKLKSLAISAGALAFSACQSNQPNANVQNMQTLPNVAVQTAPAAANAGNANFSNGSSVNVKSNQTAVSPSPTVSPTPKPTVSPNDSAAPKYKNYTVNGIVKAVDAEKNSVTIDHEDIGDYMIAMEMPFPVTNKNILKNIKVGDQVEFVLETGIGVERIIKIRKK